MTAVGFTPSGTVVAEDIRDLQGGPRQDRSPSTCKHGGTLRQIGPQSRMIQGEFTFRVRRTTSAR